MSLESELRDALHQQLDTVLDAAQSSSHRVIDDLMQEAKRGSVVTVSVHTLPKPADVAASS